MDESSSLLLFSENSVSLSYAEAGIRRTIMPNIDYRLHVFDEPNIFDRLPARFEFDITFICVMYMCSFYILYQLIVKCVDADALP